MKPVSSVRVVDTDKTLADQILEAQTRENDIENIKDIHTKDIPASTKYKLLQKIT